MDSLFQVELWAVIAFAAFGWIAFAVIAARTVYAIVMGR